MGSTDIHTPSGEIVHVVSANSSFGDASTSVSMAGGSHSVARGTRPRPVIEERCTGTQFYSLEEQRARNVAKLLKLPRQFAYIRLGTGEAMLMRIGTVTPYPYDETLMEAFRETYLTKHPRIFKPEHEILAQIEARRSALEAPDQDYTPGATKAPAFRKRQTPENVSSGSEPPPSEQPSMVVEPRDAPAHGAKRGRKPKVPLLQQVGEAYGRHLHDLDWLQECALARLPEVQQRVQPGQAMAQGQALRGLLVEAISQVIRDLEVVPGKSGIKVFLQGYLEAKPITQIAQELGVTREWCSRNYRKEALRLGGMQFVRDISREK